jgi:peptidoglycan-N-acetylglucosamine deacetylase
MGRVDRIRAALAGALISGALVVGVASTPGAPIAPAGAKHCSFTSAHSIRKVATTEKLVALTFDDGPTRGLTPKVLAALAKRNVKATFFVVGQSVKRRADVARQIVAEGHEIANHSYTHPLGNPNKVVPEVAPTSAAILAATGVQPTLFRAPGGCLNAALDAEATVNGLVPIQWSQHSGDSNSPRPSAAQLCRNALKGATPGGIIVFHDSGPLSGRGNHRSTLEALPCVIDGFRRKGFEMVTVSELLAAG